MYVPAGWAEKILKLARQAKIVKITTSPWVRDEIDSPRLQQNFPWPKSIPQPPYHGPFVVHQLVGHRHDGEKTILTTGRVIASTTDEVRSLTCIGDSSSGIE